jgi:NAD(P)-dependent dehydrogenase (short-subunit alcohol dehydrogenase family)
LLKLKDRTAVVTGAASGIGRAIAASLARRGCHLALADIDDAALARTASELAEPGVRISRYHLDVSDRDAVAAFPARVIAEHDGVDVLVNNAGVALGGTFQEVAESDFDWLFAINFFGVVRMTRAFLPLLYKSEEARLVNISSLFGLIAPPGQTAYAASKFAVRGFSESLRHELARTCIGVTVVHPGGVATSIAKCPAAEQSLRRRGYEKTEILQFLPYNAARGRRRNDRSRRRTAQGAHRGRLRCQDGRVRRTAHARGLLELAWAGIEAMNDVEFHAGALATGPAGETGR